MKVYIFVCILLVFLASSVKMESSLISLYLTKDEDTKLFNAQLANLFNEWNSTNATSFPRGGNFNSVSASDVYLRIYNETIHLTNITVARTSGRAVFYNATYGNNHANYTGVNAFDLLLTFNYHYQMIKTGMGTGSVYVNTRECVSTVQYLQDGTPDVRFDFGSYNFSYYPAVLTSGPLVGDQEVIRLAGVALRNLFNDYNNRNILHSLFYGAVNNYIKGTNEVNHLAIHPEVLPRSPYGILLLRTVQPPIYSNNSVIYGESGHTLNSTCNYTQPNSTFTGFNRTDGNTQIFIHQSVLSELFCRFSSYNGISYKANSTNRADFGWDFNSQAIGQFFPDILSRSPAEEKWIVSGYLSQPQFVSRNNTFQGFAQVTTSFVQERGSLALNVTSAVDFRVRPYYQNRIVNAFVDPSSIAFRQSTTGTTISRFDSYTFQRTADNVAQRVLTNYPFFLLQFAVEIEKDNLAFKFIDNQGLILIFKNYKVQQKVAKKLLKFLA